MSFFSLQHIFINITIDYRTNSTAYGITLVNFVE